MSATEITIKEGHLTPKTSKEVIIENDNWEVSVWVTDGRVEIAVVNRDDRQICLEDTDERVNLPLGDGMTEVALRITPKR